MSPVAAVRQARRSALNGGQLLDDLIEALTGLSPDLLLALDNDSGITPLIGSVVPSGGGGVTIGGATTLSRGTDSATAFDGTDDAINLGGFAWPNGTARSLVGIARRDTHGGTRACLLGTTSSTGPMLSLAIAGNGMDFRATANTSDGAGGFGGSASLIVDGEPFLYSVFFDDTADVASAKINGVDLGSAAVTTAIGATGVNSRLGLRAAVNPWTGLMGPFAIFESRELTLAEHRHLVRAAFGSRIWE